MSFGCFPVKAFEFFRQRIMLMDGAYYTLSVPNVCVSSVFSNVNIQHVLVYLSYIILSDVDYVAI